MLNMKRKKRFMAIKVDFEKACDWLDWAFIANTLQEVGFDNSLINIMVSCITTASMQISWNEDMTNDFKSTRGVRQGNPFSPYFFVLWLERLSHLIEDRVQSGVWHPFRFGKNGPLLSHLLFTDDMLLVAEASLDQMQVIMDCLKLFRDH